MHDPLFYRNLAVKRSATIALPGPFNHVGMVLDVPLRKNGNNVGRPRLLSAGSITVLAAAVVSACRRILIVLRAAVGASWRTSPRPATTTAFSLWQLWQL
jgi:hypothetical protein